MMDPKQREKCLKEVRLLESLDHPHIIKYLDSFIESNQLFIAIEWAEKGDLKRVIKRSISDEVTIEERKIWEYLYQIASALKHMQEKRIMHRDLKPANIFLGADGSLKLGDLGLGRFMSSQTVEAFSRVGTPLYMSPEVLKGSGYEWKSDVWSLGCITYELASLRSPFKREDEKLSLYDLFQTINKGEYPPLASKYSEELRQVVDLMIQVSPENRLSIDQVVELCQIQIKAIVKNTRADPFLVMDDIHEKLKLLHYENGFCKVTGFKPIPRVYFAHEINKSEQFTYFYNICHWIISLRGGKKFVMSSIKESEHERLATGLFGEIKSLGVKIPEYVTAESLKSGFGEAVCFVINDLMNKELIKRDYRFETPILIENGVECYGDPPETIEFYEEINAGTDEICFAKKNVGETGTENDYDYERESEKEDAYGCNFIDPKDWFAETERIFKNQDSFESEIQEIESPVGRQLRIVKQSIEDFVSSGALVFLSKKSEMVQENLERIRYFEKKLQKEHAEEIGSVSEIFARKNEVQEKYDKIKGKVEKLRNDDKSFEKRPSVSSQSSKNSVLELKKALEIIKRDIKNLDLQLELSRLLKDHYITKNKI